jgi:non-specific serine/threonine protein kinase
MSSLELLPAESVIAGYTIEEVVGRGATAAVYRAIGPGHDGPVALKLFTIDPKGDDRQERFEHEARLAAAVVHRGILPVYEVGEHEGRSFVAMKLAPGDLAALLRSQGRLEPARAVALVAQLASALDAAHAHGLVHRDVKPSNVLLEEAEGEERAYLADFGVARATFSDGDHLPGELVGTIGYASPEQIRGEPVDRRTDVYALGCLLHECLTGRVPYASRDALKTLWGHLHDEPPRPSVLVPALPRALDEVVGRALAKASEARFASAGELSEAARAALEGGPSHPQRAGASSFLGREEELREADLLLRRTRLVTIAGPGGAGKTRFALELARKAQEERFADYGDGVFSCFLSSLRDHELVVPTIAQTLSLPEQPGKSAVEAVSSQIGTRRMLLLLDNLEHLLPATTELAQLLAACPSLTLLVTSREQLHMTTEAAYELPPLDSGESVALFCDRAACEPSEPIAELCSRLDGLPLAIELAAGTSVLSPAQLLERLASRLDLLGSDDRDADPRHETLRATISWSHELLSPPEQLLLARLSVFRGGSTLESAKDVSHAQPDVLRSLVDKNLLRRTEGRFWMLETIREYAAERLESSGETGELGRRHAEYFLGLAEEAEPHLRGGERSGEWVERLEDEQDNLRAALDWLEAVGEWQLGLRLAGDLSQFWYLAGHAAEGANRLARVLGGSHESTPARAKALRAAAVMTISAGDLSAGKLYAEQAAAACRELGDKWGVAHVGFILGHAAADEESFAESEGHFEESTRLFRELGDDHYALLCTYNLAEVIALQNGDGVRPLLEQSLAEARLLSDQRIVALSLIQLGAITADEGRLEDALSMLAESLELSQSLGVHVEIVDALSRFASILGRKGEMEATARLLASAEALRQEIGSTSLRLAAKRNEETLLAVRAHLDESTFADAWERGRILSVDEAVSLALGLSASGPAPAPTT